jgi:hypothetical protein
MQKRKSCVCGNGDKKPPTIPTKYTTNKTTNNCIFTTFQTLTKNLRE